MVCWQGPPNLHGPSGHVTLETYYQTARPWSDCLFLGGISIGVWLRIMLFCVSAVFGVRFGTRQHIEAHSSFFVSNSLTYHFPFFFSISPPLRLVFSRGRGERLFGPFSWLDLSCCTFGGSGGRGNGVIFGPRVAKRFTNGMDASVSMRRGKIAFCRGS